jgi:hypothetical protein
VSRVRVHLIEVHHWTEDELDEFLAKHGKASDERIHAAEHRVTAYYAHDHRVDQLDGVVVTSGVAAR